MNRDTHIEKLKADLIRGNVVTIVGTGVSVAACRNQEVEGFNVATWTGLLRHGVKHCKDIGVADDDEVDLLTMQIESARTNFLISAAEDVSQRMQGKSPGVFRGWLKGTIGKLEIKDRSVVDAVAALPGVLCTLNYDNLLEDATDRRAITWLKTDETQDVLIGMAQDAVLHLHGWYKEPESVVLGLSSYLTVKDHPHAKAVLSLLATDRTLLFVGCGDTVLDPNFTRLIEWGKDALKDVSPRHYMLCRTSEISAFQAKLVGAPWLQPLNYGADYGDLVPFLQGLAPTGDSVAVRRSTGPVFDLGGYQQAMRKRYGRLKFEELDPTSHDVKPMMLTGMFISQSARECAEFLPRVFELPKELQKRLRQAGEIDQAELDEDLLKEHRRVYLEQSPRPILEVVGNPAFSRLVVLGDPGSGKSTLLQYLLLEWAERADAGRLPLPLLIELREYARLPAEKRSDGFLGYLHRGAGVRWHLDQAQLDEWLQDIPSLVLFDGLDEIFDPEVRTEISTAIHRFADLYPLARIVVTSRVIGFRHQTWRDEKFRHVMLQDLDEAQIADFLSRWHRGAYEEAAQGETKRALLARAIDDSASIRQLAGNPLLLTMMAILNRTQDLPRDRAELYEQCARLLLHQWKVDLAFVDYPDLKNASLDFKDKRGLMLRVARAMQTCERGLAGNLIDEESLESTLSEGLQGVPYLRPERAARALIEQLRGRNFMLCAVGGRNYAFVHRTLLEYFCAVEIHKRFSDQLLNTDQLKSEAFCHWPDETWHEVLCLLAGMLPPKSVAEILDWLLAQHDPGNTCHHVFLAARCVGEIRKRNDLGDVEARILERTKELIRFNLRHYYEPWDADAQAVSDLRSRAVRSIATIWHYATGTPSWLKDCAQADEDYAVRRSAVQELARGWKNDPETLTILRTRAQSDENHGVRRIAVQELARGWKDASDTLKWLKDRAQADEHSGVRRIAVQELARGWKDDPDTLTWLKERAQTDEHNGVRRSAMQELARGWRDDLETLTILKSRAQSDENYGVRGSAVQELARCWKDDRETLTILRNRAQADDHWAVRRIAVQELGRGWKGDTETLTILKDRAEADKSHYVRRSALQELARGWKDDPDILTWLKDRSQADEHNDVRGSAVQELARGWKSDSATLTWLKDRAEFDEHNDVRVCAVQELARGWKDDPDTLAMLKGRAQADKNYRVRRSAVEELARGWKDDPDTLMILKVRTQADEHYDVRLSAVLELARGWQDDPETLTILKNRAQADKSDKVRRSAVEELARGWQDDSETLTILKDRAQADKSDNVRWRAVEELARRWKDDPDTLTILKDRAQADEDYGVRLGAVHELARGWKDDPDTLTILKDRAQGDKDDKVRRIAVHELARGWIDEPDTLTILKDRAQADKNDKVRQIAVQELARGWKDDPDTLTILKDRAQADKSDKVRRSSVQALARGWKDDTGVQDFLANLNLK